MPEERREVVLDPEEEQGTGYEVHPQRLVGTALSRRHGGVC